MSKPRFIFITGGVVSSLGKGISASAIGALLQARGYSVRIRKLDPYINVDPGTMSPYQHGEVFVTDDGAETDLDLGHYERFTETRLNGLSSLTAGQIYKKVIDKERRGDFLGRTIQVVPHVTNEIKDRIIQLAESSKSDIIVAEVGGTVGDIEGLPFLESIRQIPNFVGKENCFYIHVTYLPFINTIRRHHAAHHNKNIMMYSNMNLTFPLGDWLFGTSDLNRGFFGHIFNGYSKKYIKKEFLQNKEV